MPGAILLVGHMPFELGCKWTAEYFFTGCLGGIAAVLSLPGSYMVMPCFRRMDGEMRFCFGALAWILVAGIAGCVVDCNPRNAFFGGFFARHFFRWLGDDGWKCVRSHIERLINK